MTAVWSGVTWRARAAAAQRGSCSSVRRPGSPGRRYRGRRSRWPIFQVLIVPCPSNSAACAHSAARTACARAVSMTPCSRASPVPGPAMPAPAEQVTAGRSVPASSQRAGEDGGDVVGQAHRHLPRTQRARPCALARPGGRFSGRGDVEAEEWSRKVPASGKGSKPSSRPMRPPLGRRFALERTFEHYRERRAHTTGKALVGTPSSRPRHRAGWEALPVLRSVQCPPRPWRGPPARRLPTRAFPVVCARRSR